MESGLGQGKLAQEKSDDLREREPAPAERQNAAPIPKPTIGDNAPAERKWPLGISLLIAVVVSVILWAGIITAGIRLWRWF